ncbi:Hypothetical predicted protein [Octopus vulgaris]|uniref:Uncharacterized protein n=1 Tax=Octopus vulgaris TaxID=6645 RepID=A0AA36ATQ1_OCTVU|nr:Hypothetical predicted protein [Octopus vulgaris]
MNLKGMETPIQYPLILILPLALTLVFSMTPLTGESTCDEVIFKEITKSKCLIDQMKILVNTSSTEECALRFSYPYFSIKGSNKTTIEAKRISGNNEKYGISMKTLFRNNSIIYEILLISVRFN